MKNRHRLIKVKSMLLLCVASLVLSACQSSSNPRNEFADEIVVHVLDEPRHRTVLQEDQLTMIDMQLRVGDESLAHLHDQAILINYISEPEGPQFARLDVNTDYATEDFIHKITNPGPFLFRVIAIFHDGNGELLNTNDQPSNMEIEPAIENNWFRAYRYELAAGESTLTQYHMNPSVIIQGMDGTTHVTREDGITRELARVGEWAYRPAESRYRITNIGDNPVVVTVNELRQQHSQ